MPGGEMLFYVYWRKGAIREFADDYVRGVVSSLAPSDAWELLRPLTRLGEALAALHVEVEVPEDVPYLGIKAGRYDVQRLIYWHFAKMYWNDRLSLDENVHVNFDWYHPAYAHRHTEEEIRRWCADNGLAITHFDVQESGYTVRAVKD
jgi:arsenite methyltransferase